MNKFVKTALAFSLVASVAVAGEFPIGDPVEANGMEIAAVYLQKVSTLHQARLTSTWRLTSTLSKATKTALVLASGYRI